MKNERKIEKGEGGKPNRKSWWIWLLVTAELLLLGFGYFAERNTGTALTLTGEQIVPFAENCTGDTTGVTIESFAGKFATTNWLELAVGSYQVAISYEGSDPDGHVEFSAGSAPSTAYGDSAQLPADRTGSVFSLWVPNQLTQAQVNFFASGTGALHINSVQFIPTHAYANTRLVTGLLLAALLDLLVLLATHRVALPCKTAKSRYVALALAGLIVFACLPLFCGYLPFGHDLVAHLARIEGLKAGLQAGQFPVRIDPFILNDKGYAFSLMYPDLLLYPAALLRIIGFSLQGTYRFTLICATAATVLVSWYCLLKMFASQRIALVGSALYTLSLYRLTDQYVRAALGETTAMIFLPLILYGFWRIYMAPRGKWDWLALAIGFSGLVQTHLLTLEMAGLLSILFCLICWRQTFRPATLLTLGKAALAAVVWNLWFFVPMLSYLGSSACRVGADENGFNGLSLYLSGVPFSQLFALFGSSNGGSNELRMGGAGEMALTPGLCLVAFALLMLLCVANREIAGSQPQRQKVQKAGMLCLCLGLGCLWLSSDTFPWYTLYEQGGVVAALLGKLQFSWRFIAPACALLTIAGCAALFLLAGTYREIAKTGIAVLLAMAVIPAGYLLFDYTYTRDADCYYGAASIQDESEQIGTGEYLPAGFEGKYTEAIPARAMTADPALTVTDYTKTGLTITMNVTNTSSGEAGATLPLFYYPGYTAKAADGALLILSSEGGFLRVNLPAGFAGNVKITFDGLWYWRLFDLISLTSVAVTIVFFCAKRKKSVYPAEKPNEIRF